MAKRDDTSKRRFGRTRIKQVTSVTSKPSDSTGNPNPSLSSFPDPLKQSIEAERTQLMRANVAAELIDEAVGRLNGIGMGKGVREVSPEYVCVHSPRIAPIDAQPLGDWKQLAAPH